MCPQTIFDALPATQQYMYHQLRTLHGSSSVEDKLRAVAGLGKRSAQAMPPAEALAALLKILMPAYLGHVQLFQSHWKELLRHF